MVPELPEVPMELPLELPLEPELLSLEAVYRYQTDGVSVGRAQAETSADSP